MTLREWLLLVPAALLAAATVLPFLPHKHWFFRGFDYLRIQVLIFLSGMLLLTLLMPGVAPGFRIGLGAGLALCAIIPVVLLLPYLPFRKNREAERSPGSTTLRLLSVNVLQDNRDFGRLLDLVRSVDPDIVLAMETDAGWVEGLSSLESDYQHVRQVPLDNTYGMCFYSRLDVRDLNVHFFLSEERPAIEARIRVEGEGEWIFIGLHPPPPSPTEETTSKKKDGELLLISRHIRQQQLPVLVSGDFNNVCWSRTARLFARSAGLQDGRRGRGFFSTFPARWWLLRFPIDLIYHSRGILLHHMKTLPSIGSDHLPLYAEFSLRPEKEQSPEPLTKEERAEIRETIQEGMEAEINEE